MKYYEKINLIKSIAQMDRLTKILYYLDSWLKLKGIMATVMSDREAIRIQLTVEDYDRDDNVLP